MQQAIDVEEDIFMRHFGTVFFTCALKNEIAYTGMPSIILVSLVKQRKFVFLVPIEREALALPDQFKIGNGIDNDTGELFCHPHARNADYQIPALRAREETGNLIGSFQYWLVIEEHLFTNRAIHRCRDAFRVVVQTDVLQDTLFQRI